MECWKFGILAECFLAIVRDELLLLRGRQAQVLPLAGIPFPHHSNIPLFQYSYEVSVGSESFERSLPLARF